MKEILAKSQPTQEPGAYVHLDLHSSAPSPTHPSLLQVMPETSASSPAICTLHFLMLAFVEHLKIKWEKGSRTTCCASGDRSKNIDSSWSEWKTAKTLCRQDKSSSLQCPAWASGRQYASWTFLSSRRAREQSWRRHEQFPCILQKRENLALQLRHGKCLSDTGPQSPPQLWTPTERIFCCCSN